MNIALKGKQDTVLDQCIEARVASMDWARVGTDLDLNGWALLDQLLTRPSARRLPIFTTTSAAFAAQS